MSRKPSNRRRVGPVQLVPYVAEIRDQIPVPGPDDPAGRWSEIIAMVPNLFDPKYDSKEPGIVVHVPAIVQNTEILSLRRSLATWVDAHPEYKYRLSVLRIPEGILICQKDPETHAHLKGDRENE